MERFVDRDTELDLLAEIRDDVRLVELADLLSVL